MLWLSLAVGQSTIGVKVAQHWVGVLLPAPHGAFLGIYCTLEYIQSSLFFGMRFDCVRVWAGGRRADDKVLCFEIAVYFFDLKPECLSVCPRKAQTRTPIGIKHFAFGLLNLFRRSPNRRRRIFLTVIIIAVMRHHLCKRKNIFRRAFKEGQMIR
jgi:hypothetical protein